MQEPQIAQYVNYRAFLRDWSMWRIDSFAETWRTIAAEMEVDFASLHKICSQELHLSSKRLPRVVEVMGLDPYESEQFQLLREIDKCRNADKAKLLRHQLLQMRSGDGQGQIHPEALFFSSWVHPALFSLLQMKNLMGDIKSVAKQLQTFLRFPVDVRKIVESLKLLVDLGLVQCSEGHQWSAVHQNVSTGIGWTDGRIRSYQKECGELANEALDTMDKQDRYISTLTLQLDEQGQRALAQEIERFQARLKEIALASRGDMELVQVNTQCFPITISQARVDA